MSLRLTFFLLVFANLIFYAWSQGYLGRVDPNREPERLNTQLQPEKLRILGTPPAAVVPRPVEVSCRRVDGLTMTDAETLKAAVLKAGIGAELMPVVDPTAYLIVIADLASESLARRKVAELKRLGITEHETVVLDDGRREIILGRHADEAAARDGLNALNKRGVRSARVEPRDLPPSSARLELRGSSAAVLQQLPALIAPYANASLSECAR